MRRDPRFFVVFCCFPRGFMLYLQERIDSGGVGMKKVLFLILKIAGIAAALILLFYLGLLVTAWI